jgi:hypothetical protein
LATNRAFNQSRRVLIFHPDFLIAACAMKLDHVPVLAHGYGRSERTPKVAMNPTIFSVDHYDGSMSYRQIVGKKHSSGNRNVQPGGG